MKWDEQADRLRRKATDDERAMLVLIGDASIADSIVGFHAQQAVEKLLKSALCRLRVRYRRTHDLTELLQFLTDSGARIPADVEDARRLSPFAVEFRYEDVAEPQQSSFDREWAAECVRAVREWVAQLAYPISDSQ